MVDADRRVDLFLNFHGSERFSCGLTTRSFVQVFHNAITARAQARNAKPNIFFDEHCVRGYVPGDIFTALLQTRGGGLGLSFLTPRFLDYPWCVAELLALLRVHRDNRNAIRLRFFCLECDPLDVLHHDVIDHFFPQFRAYSIIRAPSLSDPQRAAEIIADTVWNLWDGNEGFGDRFPAVLGGTKEHSMDYLQSQFFNNAIPVPFPMKEKALLSYHQKWEVTKTYAWTANVLDSFISMFMKLRLDMLEYHAHVRELRGENLYLDVGDGKEQSEGQKHAESLFYDSIKDTDEQANHDTML